MPKLKVAGDGRAGAELARLALLLPPGIFKGGRAPMAMDDKVTQRTYYVASEAMFVLVEAISEDEARATGCAALEALFLRRLGRTVEIAVHTVRLATEEEIVRSTGPEAEGRGGRHRIRRPPPVE